MHLFIDHSIDLKNILISILEQREMWMLNTWRSRNQSSRVQCEYRMQGIVNIWRLWNHSSRILYSVFNPSVPERFRLKLVDFFAINPSIPEGFRLRLPGEYKSNRSASSKREREREREKRTYRRARTENYLKAFRNNRIQVFEYWFEFSRSLEN